MFVIAITRNPPTRMSPSLSVVGDAAHLVVCIIGDAARFHNPTFPIERFVQPVSRRINRPFGVLTNFLVSHLLTLYVQEALHRVLIYKY